MEQTKSYSEILNELEIRSDSEILRNQVLVSFVNTELGWSDVFTVGNISTLIGRAKSRKTFFIALLTASLLGKRIPNIVNSINGNITIFDTEQGNYHVYLLARRIQRLLNIQNHPGRLRIFGLRPLTTIERVNVIENYLYSNEVQLCFIDGIRDLIRDINSCEEATEIVGKLMKWSFDRKTHICSVLHQNKSKDDQNARGHIGTEIVNKSETVLMVQKHAKDSKISIVSSVYSRGLEFQDFMFEINDSLPELIGNKRADEIKAMTKEDDDLDIEPRTPKF